ncbi:hypothetical protein ACIP10_26990 [Streptomyces galbus]|uniref:hypothetical protein n=1 Tax=Streptomyces galbus TaxID=33898 RepID=UPI0037904BBD
MQVVSSREVLAITAAAAAGAACAARWWANRGAGSASPTAETVGDRVEELHLAFRDRTGPSPQTPEEVLRLYWSQLHPLELDSPAGTRPVAPTA